MTYRRARFECPTCWDLFAGLWDDGRMTPEGLVNMIKRPCECPTFGCHETLRFSLVPPLNEDTHILLRWLNDYCETLSGVSDLGA